MSEKSTTQENGTAPEMRPIPIIAGPTAVGKTATSVRIAQKMDAEIVSADSRQVYREFSIGTACPTAEEQAGIRHHFVQEISIGEPFSAGIFATKVSGVVADILNRDKNVLVTGGSTLYVHALLHGLSDIPAVDASIRMRLNKRLEVEGPEALHTELVAVDPVFAKTLDSSKSHRIIRGLEVFEGTGKQLSSFHSSPPLPQHSFQLFVLHRDRQVLYEAINQRVEDMFARGLVAELQAVLSQSPDLSDNAFRTIGYQELLPYLEGDCSLDETIHLVKRNSRRYAKRQMTWYRRYPDAVWIDVDKEDATDRIYSLLHKEIDGPVASASK